ncbi:MAG TPA: F0F1 ATP synthase subunit epsilon [Campylobacterales bacterium]|nr:F0F1 ATP synthase subunit epsilon [Campylobacterales bacterium]
MESLKLELITPDGRIFCGDVKEVLLPGEEGEFGVLPQHASLFTLLSGGIIEFTKLDGSIENVVINGGNVTVEDNRVIALVNGAVVLPEHQNGDTAKALEEVQKLLEKVSNNETILASVQSKLG